MMTPLLVLLAVTLALGAIYLLRAICDALVQQFARRHPGVARLSEPFVEIRAIRPELHDARFTIKRPEPAARVVMGD